jgi:hypothetical protein
MSDKKSIVVQAKAFFEIDERWLVSQPFSIQLDLRVAK